MNNEGLTTNIFQRLFLLGFGSQLRRNMYSGVISTLISVFTVVISYPLYLHFLDYSKYGLWVVLSTVLSFAQLGILGINQAIMKLVAQEYAQENLQGIQSYIAMALAILTVTGTSTLLLILIFKGHIITAFKLQGDNTELASWLLPYIGFLTIYVFFVQVFNATLAGLGRMDLANYIQVFSRVITVAVAVGLLSVGLGIESLLIANGLSYVIVHISSLFFIRRLFYLRFLKISNWDWHRMKNLLHFGGGVCGGSLLAMFCSPFNKLMLSRYVGVSSVPVYEIAFNGSMQIRAIFDAGIRAIIPKISHISVDITSQKIEKIFMINRRIVKLIIIWGVPIFGCLIIMAKIFLKVWLKGSFVDAMPMAFRIMLVATFISLLGAPAYYTHMGQGRIRHCFISHFIISFLNVIVVLFYVIISPATVELRVYHAVLLGQFGSTAYLIWQLHRGHNYGLEVKT